MKPLTRRGLLSMVSSIFDPLGFAAPYIIVAKKIMQELTFKKISWDEPLPDKERTEWLEWAAGLTEMERYKISRCMKPNNFGVIARAEPPFLRCITDGVWCCQLPLFDKW